MAKLGRVYQTSDLAGGRRREFLDEARAGAARLRDTDGTPLLMVPEGCYQVLAELRDWMLAYLTLEAALARPRPQRRVEDLGPLAWAAVFDDEDLETFRQELSAVLSRATASRRLDLLERLVGDWARTARALEDDEVRAALTGDAADDDFVEVGPPSAGAQGRVEEPAADDRIG